MSCEYRLDELRLCAILDIECNNPEKNNPDNYNIETGFPCICGMFEYKK